jgi:putative restriction endonuclease
MNAYIGNTDYDWYSFLSSRPDLDEVNFWRPGGGTTFKSLAPGEPFFFKLKQAHGHR